MNVHQVLSGAGPYDAVTNEALDFRARFTEWGWRGRDVAAALDPRMDGRVAPLTALAPAQHDVLLIDEVLAVGDEAFQRKCEARVAAQVEAGATLVLVSHDAALVERTCERVVVLDGGAVVFDGPAADGLGFYHELMGTIPGASASAVRTAVTGDPRTREVTPS